MKLATRKEEITVRVLNSMTGEEFYTLRSRYDWPLRRKVTLPSKTYSIYFTFIYGSFNDADNKEGVVKDLEGSGRGLI